MSCNSSALPVTLSLLAALLFAVGIQFSRLGLRRTDSRTATLITITTATVLCWLLAPWLVRPEYWLSSALPLLAAIGLFRPVLSSNLGMAGTRHLGPTISSSIASTAPFFALAFGILFLDERVTPLMLAGTVALVGGVMMLSRGGRDRAGRNWPLWALLLPVGAAVLRVLAQLLAKVAMETLPSPFFVALVGYTVSCAVAWGVHLWRGQTVGAVFERHGPPWLVLTGFFYGLAILTLNGALQCGQLVVVGPIVSVEPVFAMLLGLFVFREEHIDRRVVGSVLVVAAGVAAITAAR